MALGGGTFTAQNKILPGTYINFVSIATASTALSDRGVATLALEMDWGPEGEIFTVGRKEFSKNSLSLFGRAYSHEKLKPLREIFAGCETVHLYRLGTGGVKATNDYATALYPGARGNDIKIVIEPGEDYTDSSPVYDVCTHLDTAQVDVQTVSDAAGLSDNAFVAFKGDAALTLTAGTPLTGGADGTVTDGDHQSYLDKAETYRYNAMGCMSDSETVKALYTAFCIRMRDEVGMKFQLVVHKYAADFEGVISIENNKTAELVPWVTGAQAGCAINKSLTNYAYSGEYAVAVDYTQTQLEDALETGKLIMHRVDDEIHILEDINTLVGFTEEKKVDFSSNQTIRVLDQIATDIATIFNNKYLGKIPNDNAGRISLWNDIVSHHQELATARAIEEFNSADIIVEPGDDKKSVVVSDAVTPINAMAKLYMTVVVS